MPGGNTWLELSHTVPGWQAMPAALHGFTCSPLLLARHPPTIGQERLFVIAGKTSPDHLTEPLRDVPGA